MSLFGNLWELGKEVGSWDKEPISKEESDAQTWALEARARKAEAEYDATLSSREFKETKGGGLFGGEEVGGGESSGITIRRLKEDEGGGREEKWPWDGEITHDVMGDFRRLYPKIKMEYGERMATLWGWVTVARLKRQGVREEDAKKKVNSAVNRLKNEGERG